MPSRTIIITALFAGLLQLVSCQFDVNPPQNTCTCSGVMVIGREEMRREIRTHVAAALANGYPQTTCNTTCRDDSSFVSQIEQIRKDFFNITVTLQQLREDFNSGDKFATENNITPQIEQLKKDFSNKLDKVIQPIMNKLNSLHQPGKTPSHPAASCSEVLDFDESTPSGYYWLQSSDGSSVRVYCDMTRTCKGASGPWMQVAKLDMTNSTNQCPSGLRTVRHGNKRLCGINSDGASCSSVLFDTHGIGYSRVCGKIIAYQDKTPDAFGGNFLVQRNGIGARIDQNYVDGVSLTHGYNPRKHIWTFAAAVNEADMYPVSNCPCTNIHQTSRVTRPPSFVGNDYFCDTGSTHQVRFDVFYSDDPLWDGQGCGPANTCCSLNTPPWFLKQLPSSTTDDIEMRLCGDEVRSNEDIPIEVIELYVQ